jgi:hypothetical protein
MEEIVTLRFFKNFCFLLLVVNFSVRAEVSTTSPLLITQETTTFQSLLTKLKAQWAQRAQAKFLPQAPKGNSITLSQLKSARKERASAPGNGANNANNMGSIGLSKMEKGGTSSDRFGSPKAAKSKSTELEDASSHSAKRKNSQKPFIEEGNKKSKKKKSLTSDESTPTKSPKRSAQKQAQARSERHEKARGTSREKEHHSTSPSAPKHSRNREHSRHSAPEIPTIEKTSKDRAKEQIAKARKKAKREDVPVKSMRAASPVALSQKDSQEDVRTAIDITSASTDDDFIMGEETDSSSEETLQDISEEETETPTPLPGQTLADEASELEEETLQDISEEETETPTPLPGQTSADEASDLEEETLQDISEEETETPTPPPAQTSADEASELEEEAHCKAEALFRKLDQRLEISNAGPSLDMGNFLKVKALLLSLEDLFTNRLSFASIQELIGRFDYLNARSILYLEALVQQAGDVLKKFVNDLSQEDYASAEEKLRQIHPLFESEEQYKALPAKIREPFEDTLKLLVRNLETGVSADLFQKVDPLLKQLKDSYCRYEEGDSKDPDIEEIYKKMESLNRMWKIKDIFSVAIQEQLENKYNEVEHIKNRMKELEKAEESAKNFFERKYAKAERLMEERKKLLEGYPTRALVEHSADSLQELFDRIEVWWKKLPEGIAYRLGEHYDARDEALEVNVTETNKKLDDLRVWWETIEQFPMDDEDMSSPHTGASDRSRDHEDAQFTGQNQKSPILRSPKRTHTKREGLRKLPINYDQQGLDDEPETKS